VSRWDRLKDPVGVIEGFAEHVAPNLDEIHLVLAGPAVAADQEPVVSGALFVGATMAAAVSAEIRRLQGARR
jgi:hypothetical protein